MSHNSLGGFQAVYHPELVARIHAALDGYLREGKSSEELDAVVREILQLPRSEIMVLTLEVYATAEDSESAIFRSGLLSGSLRSKELQLSEVI